MLVAPSTSWMSPIKPSQEFQRIRNLPLRIWWQGEDEEKLRLDMSEWLRLPGSTAELRPIQSATLESLHDENGCFAAIRVGGGKTLISLLAPVVVEAQRPLLIVPASLRDKTKRDARLYAQDWQIARGLTIMSYEKLSVLSGLEALDRIRPDLIILDECHKAKDSGRPRAKRLKRYLKANECKVLAMTGTIANRSLREYWHIMRWCLPSSMPLPRDLLTFLEWCEALDEIGNRPKRHPGVLIDLHPEAKGNTPLLKARDAYARRLAETPGVVISRDRGPNLGLIIKASKPPFNREILEPAIRQLRKEWRVPDGEPFELAIDLWRHVRTVASGFYHRWNPLPPQEYIDARLAWSRYCRYVIYQLKRGIDTPGHVKQMIIDGHLEDNGILEEWEYWNKEFIPNSEVVWLDDSLIQYAAKWLHKKAGLVWTEHRDFGEKLSEVSGLPFFANHGKDKQGRYIEAWKNSAIVSCKSNQIGRNLQHWNRNLLIGHSPTGYLFEQTLGRTHRDGNKADEIYVEIPMITLEQWKEFHKALRDAHFIEETTRQPQKLVYATKDIPDAEEVHKRGDTDYLWKEE